jgi:hypothetical protein
MAGLLPKAARAHDNAQRKKETGFGDAYLATAAFRVSRKKFVSRPLRTSRRALITFGTPPRLSAAKTKRVKASLLM